MVIAGNNHGEIYFYKVKNWQSALQSIDEDQPLTSASLELMDMVITGGSDVVRDVQILEVSDVE